MFLDSFLNSSILPVSSVIFRGSFTFTHLFLMLLLLLSRFSHMSDSVRPQRRQPTRLLRPGIFQARVLLGSNSFQFITGELMLLFIIPLPNLEKRNFGAQADKQPSQAKDYFKKRRPGL